MRGGGSIRRAAWLLAAGLLACAAGLAGAQCPDPVPGGEVLFGWNDEEQDGWLGAPGPVLNTNSQFIMEGSGSAEVDMTDQPTWASGAFTLDLEEPQDWSGYGLVSVDVYAPMESIGEGSGWNELWLEVGGDYRGVRGLSVGGWRRIFWSLNPERSTAVQRVVIGGNVGVPFAGPLYFDNFRVYPGSPRGLAENEILIAGFNEASDISRFNPTIHNDEIEVSPIRTTESQFVTEGSGALELDLTGIRGWRPGVLQPADMAVGNLSAAMDLSAACSIKADIFVPDESHPAWYSVGLMLQGQTGGLVEYVGSVVPGWNTFVVPITDDQRESLKDVDKVWFLVGSGDDDAGTWMGPIYIDAVRAVMPATTAPPPPTGTLGDVNGDNAFNIQDVVAALRAMAGLTTLTPAQRDLADVNADDNVNIQDVVFMLRRVAGLIPSFPAEQ